MINHEDGEVGSLCVLDVSRLETAITLEPAPTYLQGTKSDLIAGVPMKATMADE
jgi:hypothetical protein